MGPCFEALISKRQASGPHHAQYLSNSSLLNLLSRTGAIYIIALQQQPLSKTPRSGTRSYQLLLHHYRRRWSKSWESRSSLLTAVEELRDVQCRCHQRTLQSSWVGRVWFDQIWDDISLDCERGTSPQTSIQANQVWASNVQDGRHHCSGE